jgi:hypothetical protein
MILRTRKLHGAGCHGEKGLSLSSASFLCTAVNNSRLKWDMVGTAPATVHACSEPCHAVNCGRRLLIQAISRLQPRLAVRNINPLELVTAQIKSRVHLDLYL